MFQIVFASVIASAFSHRIQLDVDTSQSKSQSNFGATCDDLQALFHGRVTAFQTVLDANPDLSTIGRATQVGFVMKTYGVVRTLRRARLCPWVVEGNGGDIEQLRDIVQTLIAGNPCAEAARVELVASASAETSEVEIDGVRRSMSILMSENCEVIEVPEEQVDEATLDFDAQLNDAEAEVQDGIDEFADALDGESGAAFIQSDFSLRGFAKGLGMALLFVLLLLACVGAAVAIGAFLATSLLALSFSMGWVSRGSPASMRRLAWLFRALFGGGLIGGVAGLSGCSIPLFRRLLQ